MAALITDGFRLLNADNFIESVSDPNNSYYIFVGLPNPVGNGYGRTLDWNDDPPSPEDSISYTRHVYDTMLYGRRVTPANVKRIIRRIDWKQGTRYEQYRDDYSVGNVSPNTGATRLYDANYYVITSEFRVYICLSNGSNGDNPKGNGSQDEPDFVDTEPSPAGTSGDGYIWKYLFTISPSDVIKFDSTEYITVPSDWDTSTNPQIVAVRESGDSDANNSQIKQIYIDKSGEGYSGSLGQALNIIGDGTGAEAIIDVSSGRITRAIVARGGKGYSWGLVDLGNINKSASRAAKLDVIIPPSKGHGFDIYQELGTDRAIVYARFDDSTNDFPIDSKFAQVGLLKDPTIQGSTAKFVENTFTASESIKLDETISGDLEIGEMITQVTETGFTAKGYVASFDKSTMVLKYIQDRSLFYNPFTYDNQDYVGITTSGRKIAFESSGAPIRGENGFSGSVDTTFNGAVAIIGDRNVDLGVEFTNGLAKSEINKPSGEILYLNNRPEVKRNPRQKEDVKIILEF